MIVRAGGLTLHAPDEMPEEAREAVAALQALTLVAQVAAATGHPDADMSDAVKYMAAVEVAAFGRRDAERLRRCGEAARRSASRQLVIGWGQGVSPCR